MRKSQPKAAAPGINVADVRKTLHTKIKTLIHKQTGPDSSNDECREMFKEIAPHCKTSHGNMGEVPESLSDTTDAAWISNMIQFVVGQIAHVVSTATT